jgi:hypothetical protein
MRRNILVRSARCEEVFATAVHDRDGAFRLAERELDDLRASVLWTALTGVCHSRAFKQKVLPAQSTLYITELGAGLRQVEKANKKLVRTAALFTEEPFRKGHSLRIFYT